MRPQPGGDAHSPSSSAKPRSRKSSVDHHVPTTFIMKRVEDLEHAPGTPHVQTSIGRKRASTYGVQSLADTLEAAFGSEHTTSSKKADVSGITDELAQRTARTGSHSSSADSMPSTGGHEASPLRKSKRESSGTRHPTSAALSSINAPSCVPTPGIPSTPRSESLVSLKLSDEEFTLEDSASQAIASSGDEEDETYTQQAASEPFPQLVMPSIQMPTRRPFTTKGKAMGKLKVMVAGQAETGKSSLIRSIVQACEDIVHVDPLSPSQSISQPDMPKSKARRRRIDQTGTTRIIETHASTKPYPHWFADVEESPVLRRRKSGLDSVLERNICFVDTPGYVEGPTEIDDMDVVVNHVASLLYQTASVATLDDNDVLGVVSGSGGVLVDVVIYLLPPSKDITKDIQFMERLSSLTNVIPVISKSDTLTATEAVALKTSILSRLQATTVRPFLFGKALDDALLAVQGLPIALGPTVDGTGIEPSQFPFATPTHPYSISSSLDSDSENMDASLLMSPDYVQPLLPSELSALINQVFDPESIAWLRHSAAKKFLAWRRKVKLPGDVSIPQGVQRSHSPTTASIGLNTAINTSATSSLFSAASPSGILVPRSGSPFYTSSNLQSPFLPSSPSFALSESHDTAANFSLTRWTRQTQGEGHLSELRIAKWATDLQRSLRNERDRYEQVHREDRAKRVLGRVGEEVSRGSILASPGQSPRADWAVIRHGNEKQPRESWQRYAQWTGLDSRDPLGLCNFTDEVRRRGFVLVKVLGGMSVLGAVVVAVVRLCNIDLNLPQDGWVGWLTSGSE
ncbi:hypothetical protein ACN47E_000320 [Coniothyrium glycines]